jgi:hypothetical protein
MKNLKNLWDALSGWKSAIAAIYWPIVTQILPIWFPQGVPDNINKIIVTLGIMLTIAGVGHKAWKATHAEE